LSTTSRTLSASPKTLSSTTNTLYQRGRKTQTRTCVVRTTGSRTTCTHPAFPPAFPVATVPFPPCVQTFRQSIEFNPKSNRFISIIVTLPASRRIACTHINRTLSIPFFTTSVIASSSSFCRRLRRLRRRLRRRRRSLTPSRHWSASSVTSNGGHVGRPSVARRLRCVDLFKADLTMKAIYCRSCACVVHPREERTCRAHDEASTRRHGMIHLTYLYNAFIQGTSCCYSSHRSTIHQRLRRALVRARIRGYAPPCERW